MLALLAALLFALLLVVRSNPNAANPLPLATATIDSDGTAADAATAVAAVPLSSPTTPPSPTAPPTAAATVVSADPITPTVTSTVTPTVTLTDVLAATLTDTSIDLTAEPATETQLALEPAAAEPRIFSNPNAANAIAVVDNTLWLATDGGVLARNLASGAQ